MDKTQKREKYITIVVFTIFALLLVGSFYPLLNKHNTDNKITGKASEISLLSAKSADDYYLEFQCPCCGKPIDTNCCGMAKQRKEYLDTLLLDGAEENEIFLSMIKKFGFETLMDPSKEQEIKDYIKSIASDNPSEITIDNPKYDFGTIKQSEGIVSTSFTIKNTGASDLIIDAMETSCMCTSATLIYDGAESPKFGMSMHGENPENYELIIPPGKEAELKVFYDPMAHGIQKEAEQKIKREVTITSNDPVNFQKKVRIELIQVI